MIKNIREAGMVMEWRGGGGGRLEGAMFSRGREGNGKGRSGGCRGMGEDT